MAKNCAIYIGAVDQKKDKYGIVRVMNGHLQAVRLCARVSARQAAWAAQRKQLRACTQVIHLQFHPSKPILVSVGHEGVFFWNYETG